MADNAEQPALFVRSNQEDWSVGFRFTDENGNAVDIRDTNREFKVEFKQKGVGAAVATLDTGAASLSTSDGSLFTGRVDNSTTGVLDIDWYSADFIMYDTVAGTDTKIVTAQLHHVPAGTAGVITSIYSAVIDPETLGVSPYTVVAASGAPFAAVAIASAEAALDSENNAATSEANAASSEANAEFDAASARDYYNLVANEVKNVYNSGELFNIKPKFGKHIFLSDYKYPVYYDGSDWKKTVDDSVKTFNNAALCLNFIEDQSRIDAIGGAEVTFTAASLATIYDETGKITYKPNNLLIQSDFATGWTASGATLTIDDSPDQDGVLNAARLQGTSGARSLSRNATLIEDVEYILSVWVKSKDGADYTFRLTGDTSQQSGNIIATSAWRRVSFKFTATTSGARSHGIEDTAGGANYDIVISDIQLEAVTYETSPREYNATTTAVFYGERFGFDPITLEPKGLQIEPGKTNLMTYTSKLTTNWTALGFAVKTTAYATAPDGQQTAIQLKDDNSAGSGPVYLSSATQTVSNSTDYTFSIYAKKDQLTWFVIQTIGFTTPADVATYFDLENGVMGSQNHDDQQMVDVGNGWYRCSITFNTDATDTDGLIRLFVSDGNNDITVDRDGTSSILLWGAQFEASSVPTSYIPTGGASLSRSADQFNLTGADFTSWFNQTEGTLVIEYEATIAGYWLFEIQEDTSNRYLLNDSSGKPVFFVVKATVNEFLGDTGTATYGDVQRVSIGYKANDVRAARNGTLTALDTAVALPAPTTMAIGRAAVNAAYIGGFIRSIVYYNTRLVDATVGELSG